MADVFFGAGIDAGEKNAIKGFAEPRPRAPPESLLPPLSVISPPLTLQVSPRKNERVFFLSTEIYLKNVFIREMFSWEGQE